MTMNWTKAAELVHAAENVVLVTHVGPDGDAIGSILGLAWSLRQLGKSVTCTVDGGCPEDFLFMQGASEILPEVPQSNFDLAIAVDCGDVGRMGQCGQAIITAGMPLINVDHHITNTMFGDANLVDTQTVATCEGLVDWLPSLGVTLDETISECLLVGLVTDTLCFRTSNITSAVMGKAQTLMEAGASMAKVTQLTVNRRPLSVLRLWSLVMPTLQLEPEGVIWVAIDHAAAEEADLGEDRDGLVSTLLTADGVNVAAVFREFPDRGIEMSFRAMPGYNVSKPAVALGGGGHAQAAGCTIAGPMDEAIEKALLLLREAAAEGSPVEL